MPDQMNSQLDQGITAADLSPDDLLSEADQKEISDFLAVLNAPGWAVASSCKKDGLKVLWKKEADHPVVLVKAEIKVMVPAMTAFNFLDGSDDTFEARLKVIDKLCKAGRNVARRDAKHSVKWALFHLPPPLSNRDFVWSDLCTTLPDGSSLSIGKSVHHESCPEPKAKWLFGEVRGELRISGYYVVPAEEAGACTVHYVVQADLKGMLPVSIVNALATDQGKNIRRMKEHLEAHTAKAHAATQA